MFDFIFNSGSAIKAAKIFIIRYGSSPAISMKITKLQKKLHSLFFNAWNPLIFPLNEFADDICWQSTSPLKNHPTIICRWLPPLRTLGAFWEWCLSSLSITTNSSRLSIPPGSTASFREGTIGAHSALGGTYFQYCRKMQEGMRRKQRRSQI